MRYLILTPDFPPRHGGVQTLVATLADGLAERHDVTVVTPAAAGDAVCDADKRYVVRRYRDGVTRAGKTVALIQAAASAARRADVVICGHVAAVPAAWLLGDILRKPFFVYVHGMEVTPKKYRPFLYFVLRRAAGVITGSRYGRDLVAKYFHLRPEDVVVIPPAVSPTLVAAARGDGARPVPKEAGGKIILTVGRLARAEQYKGHDVVIRALPFIRRCVPDIRYWIVGGGDDERRLRDLAAASGVADAVTFWGSVADVAPYYRACDIFVMPSRCVVTDDAEKAEGFGLTFIEASLFAKPVVAGKCAGAEEAVADGETGLLVNPESPAEVAAAVVALLVYVDEARKLGVAGRARVFKHYTADRQVAALEQAVGARAGRRETARV